MFYIVVCFGPTFDKSNILSQTNQFGCKNDKIITIIPALPAGDFEV